MQPGIRTYVEHVAIRVTDIRWHLRFFREALGMTVRDVDGDPEAPRQAWLHGGLQLIADPGFAGPEGRHAHLGVMADDLEATLAAAAGFGVTPLPQGRNWFALPDGLCIEVLQASPGAVAAALAVDPRA
ncbi:MAG: glyoxalase [Betaproteobacteria bacterium]|nr:MAG: glyoxalase [Betaproteobacteria bacterium]